MVGRHAAASTQRIPRWVIPAGAMLAVLALVLVFVLPRFTSGPTNDASGTSTGAFSDTKQRAGANASGTDSDGRGADDDRGSIAGPEVTAPASESESKEREKKQKRSKKPNDKDSKDSAGGSPEIPSDPKSIEVLANKKRPIEPLTYAPTDLVSIGSGQSLRSEAAKAYKKMRDAAAATGVRFHPISGYRSYSQQAATYNHWKATYGQQHADSVSAAPGTSEHQLGLAVDVTDGICKLRRCFGNTEAGQWVAKNAHKYGFVIRYPEGKSDITGYWPEPWHLRYVGVDLAKELTTKGLTLEEHYKWKPDK